MQQFTASEKDFGVCHNVMFRVLDSSSGKVVSTHKGHNAATNTLLTGIGHYLKGDGILNQGYDMLGMYVPRYISLGTMGLLHQEQDSEGLPTGIGVYDYVDKTIKKAYEDAKQALKDAEAKLQLTVCKICKDFDHCESKCTGPCKQAKDAYDAAKKKYEAALEAYQKELESDEEKRFTDYIAQVPGFGADGYDPNLNNGREYMGLGPAFADRPDKEITAKCELISASFPRSEIAYRELVPENQAEFPETIDVFFSAMVSTGALRQFREPGKDYIFITEAGLWSRRDWVDGKENGLLAGYRIGPPNEDQWDMTKPENRDILKHNVLKVGVNQIVQVIWKIQLGAIKQFSGMADLYPNYNYDLNWWKWQQ